MRPVVILLILAASAATADAEETAQPFKLPDDVAVYNLPEASNGIHYRLYVRTPLREPAAGEKPATFYFLDPLATFLPAVAIAQNCDHFSQGFLPSAYFIGIGYQDEADGKQKEHNRTRDYTPTRFEPPDETHFLAGSPGSYEGSGGADAFFDVVETQIVPFIEGRYDVDESDRVLIGKSMSGLAAVHALLTRPGLFKRYVIISPSIWWDDRLDERSDRSVMRTVSNTSNVEYPLETWAYFAVGDAEERLGIVTDLHVLANALRERRPDNLKVSLDVFPGEQHEWLFSARFLRGIIGIYADEPGSPVVSPVKFRD